MKSFQFIFSTEKRIGFKKIWSRNLLWQLFCCHVWCWVTLPWLFSNLSPPSNYVNPVLPFLHLGYDAAKHVTTIISTIVPNDCAKTKVTMTHFSYATCGMVTIHTVNTGVKKRLDSPFEFCEWLAVNWTISASLFWTKIHKTPECWNTTMTLS